MVPNWANALNLPYRFATKFVADFDLEHADSIRSGEPATIPVAAAPCVFA